MWHPAFGRPTVDLGADAPQRHRGYGSTLTGQPSPTGGEGGTAGILLSLRDTGNTLSVPPAGINGY